MNNTENGKDAERQIEKFFWDRGTRLIGHIKHKLHERKSKKEKDNPSDRAARKTASATIWIAIFTVVLAVANLLTLWEVIQGGNDTHELAVQAKRQADKMKDMSDAAEKIRQAAQDMVTQDQRIADNAQKAMDASNIQSKASLGATQESMRQDQRAWISTESAIGIPTNERPFTIQIPIKNSGKTPARNVAIFFMGKFFKLGQRFTYQFEGQSISLGYIPPNSPRSFTYFGEPESSIDATAHKGDIFVIYGAVTYDDVFFDKHWVTYCFYVQKTDSYTYCKEHNDIGDGQLPKDSLQFQSASSPN